MTTATIIHGPTCPCATKGCPFDAHRDPCWTKGCTINWLDRNSQEGIDTFTRTDDTDHD